MSKDSSYLAALTFAALAARNSQQQGEYFSSPTPSRAAPQNLTPANRQIGQQGTPDSDALPLNHNPHAIVGHAMVGGALNFDSDDDNETLEGEYDDETSEDEDGYDNETSEDEEYLEFLAREARIEAAREARMMELIEGGSKKRKADDSSSSEESTKKPRTDSECSDSITTEGRPAPTLKDRDDATTSEDSSTASDTEEGRITPLQTEGGIEVIGKDSPPFPETDSI